MTFPAPGSMRADLERSSAAMGEAGKAAELSGNNPAVWPVWVPTPWPFHSISCRVKQHDQGLDRGNDRNLEGSQQYQ